MGVDAHDEVEVLIALELDGVDNVDVLFVSLHALRQGLAQDEVVEVAVVDAVPGERLGEPGLGHARVKDAATVGKARHVVVEELRRRGDGQRPEDLWLLAVDPVVVVEAKEEGKDDVAEVAEPEGGQVLLEEADGGDELLDTKDGGPPLAGAELAHEGEGELAQHGAGIDGGTNGGEGADLLADLGAHAWRESNVHGARALRVANVGHAGPSSSAGDELDDVAEVIGELLDTKGPEAGSFRVYSVWPASKLARMLVAQTS
ncbi:hypothetical protein L7F22_053466 [Adiantum nelumboides]|nr:hypothetical protein [Adiantum nelumboides]